MANPYRYAGREYDTETGLYFNRARYYDPQLGRFVSEDPIGLAGGINLYVYAGSDPVNATDPWGLLPCRYCEGGFHDGAADVQVRIKSDGCKSGWAPNPSDRGASAPRGEGSSGGGGGGGQRAPARIRAYTKRIVGCRNPIQFSEWSVYIERDSGRFPIRIRFDRVTWSVQRTVPDAAVIEEYVLSDGNFGYYRGRLFGYGRQNVILPAEATVDCESGEGDFYADSQLP